MTPMPDVPRLPGPTPRRPANPTRMAKQQSFATALVVLRTGLAALGTGAAPSAKREGA
jgi:hypothetical protein